LTVLDLCTLQLETAIIGRYLPRKSSVEEAPIKMYLAIPNMWRVNNHAGGAADAGDPTTNAGTGRPPGLAVDVNAGNNPVTA
jgi:hypothetical protein